MNRPTNCPKCGGIWGYDMCCECLITLMEWIDEQGLMILELREYIDSNLSLKNAENLRLFMREFDKRTNPENSEPDMRELGQDVALMCMMMHKYRRQALELKLGNTALISALMGMMGQYCTDEDGTINHSCMSAGEDAEDVLIRAGFIRDNKLDWKALEKRQSEKATEGL